MAYNSVTVAGNVVKDGDLRYTQSGTAVLNFTIAINPPKNRDNPTAEVKPTYVDIKVWGGSAPAVAKLCKQGTPLIVVGKLDNERMPVGEKNYRKTVVNAWSVGTAILPDRPTGNLQQTKPGETDVPY